MGIKTPSLYSHYRSKDEIIEAMIQEEIRHYFSCLEERLVLTQCLNFKETLQELYGFIMEYFNDRNRLRFWRSIPLIPNEKLKSTCSLRIAEQDVIYNQQLRQRFVQAAQDGEIRADVSEDALYLYLCMIQGVMDGMLMYPKGMDGNLFALRVFDAYWSGIGVNQ